MPICHRSTDARALRVRVVETLKEFPDGASCVELEAAMGDARYSISSIVSKMRCYGGPIDMVRDGQRIKWRLREIA